MKKIMMLMMGAGLLWSGLALAQEMKQASSVIITSSVNSVSNINEALHQAQQDSLQKAIGQLLSPSEVKEYESTIKGLIVDDADDFIAEIKINTQEAQNSANRYTVVVDMPALKAVINVMKPEVVNVEALEKLAVTGDLSANHKLGHLYYHGQGVGQDYVEAAQWFKRAANQKYAPSQYALGVMYFHGDGVQRDTTEAQTWLQKATEQDYVPAKYALALLVKSVSWLQKAADQGYAPAQHLMGGVYSTGSTRLGIPEDTEKALALYRMAAKQGYTPAQMRLAHAYEFGLWDIPVDEKKGIEWHQTAQKEDLREAQLGNIEKQLALAQIYHYYKFGDLQIDHAEAVKWYKEVAQQRPVDSYRPYWIFAAQALGRIYSEGGNGVSQDEVESQKWFLKAHKWLLAESENGSSAGLLMHSIGTMHEKGEGVAQDDAEAKKWFLKAMPLLKAESGLGNALPSFIIGSMYDKGKGVPQDYAEAVKWYKRAAEQGSWSAYLSLEEMYEKGRGVIKDEKEAEHWRDMRNKNEMVVGDLFYMFPCSIAVQ